jgi:hypothetical protein
MPEEANMTAGFESASFPPLPVESPGNAPLSARDRLRAGLLKRQGVVVRSHEQEAFDIDDLSEQRPAKRPCSLTEADIRDGSEEDLFSALPGADANADEDQPLMDNLAPGAEDEDGLWGETPQSADEFGRYPAGDALPGDTSAADQDQGSPAHSDVGDLHAELLEFVDS